MTREITHMKAFAAALESLEKPAFSIGMIAPSPGVVKQFFNDSTGEGDMGEVDSRGPWNEGGDWEFVEAPAFQANGNGSGEKSGNGHDPALKNSLPANAEAIQETLIEHLLDLLHAEKQLVKALPKMARAAQAAQLRECFELHLAETEEQVDRLMLILEMLGAASAKPKPCKGMMGLIEEGEEVMAQGKKKEPYIADVSLIGAAHKIEHYEIASYITARNLAVQLRNPEISRLLQMSLAEEQNSDLLPDQIGRPLTSAMGRPPAVV